MPSYPRAIEAAIASVVSGVTEDKLVPAGAGRPSSKRIVNGIILDRMEYVVYSSIMDFSNAMKGQQKNELMTDEQFTAFMKASAPLINKRMIDLAKVSDKLSEVRAVASDLADRGFGKAASQINLNIGVKDIRRGWQEIINGNIIDVTNLIEAEVEPVKLLEAVEENASGQ